MNSHALIRAAFFLLLLSPPLVAQVVVFWQPGFPAIASQPVDHATLSAVLHPAFLDLNALKIPGALEKTELLVLPYGSAVPTDAWKAIEAYLQHGGNLLVLGGQPLRVPVTQSGATFVPAGRRIPIRGRWIYVTPTKSLWGEMPILRGGRAMRLRPRRHSRQKNSSPWRVISTDSATWSTRRACGCSAGHRDRSSTRRPHRLSRLSANLWVLGESGWHGAHSPICRLCTPGFDQSFR